MRIGVLDDDLQETEEFLSALRGWDPSRNAECFCEGQAFLDAAQKQPHFSAAFIDIYLPKENGMDIAARLREIAPDTEIIFTTTSTEHAVDAFAINAVHYIVKPVTTEDIKEAFMRMMQKRKIRTSISLKVDKGNMLVYTDEIATAQSQNHHMDVFLKNGNKIDANIKCSELLSLLGENFIQIQRGYIVNMDFIKKMSPNSCILQDDKTLLLSRKDKREICNSYNDYVYRRLSEGHI